MKINIFWKFIIIGDRKTFHMIYNVLVAGSGLSSMAFLSLCEKKKKFMLFPQLEKKVKSINNSYNF